VTVSDAALNAVAANALRHLLEADQQYIARRYAERDGFCRAVIQERGKLAFLASTGFDTQGQRALKARHARRLRLRAPSFLKAIAVLRDRGRARRRSSPSANRTADGEPRGCEVSPLMLE
jgi:hypothetical protein